MTTTDPNAINILSPKDKSFIIPTTEGDYYSVYGEQPAVVPMDVSRYEKFFPNKNVQLLPDMDRYRASQQSTWAQAGGFLMQSLIGEVVGGTISGFGNLYEGVKDLINVADPNYDSDFNNIVVEIGQSIKDFGKDKFPIYRENPGKAWDVGDPAWWAENAVSIASTLSLLIPATGTVKGLGAIGKALGIADKASEVAQYWGKVGTTAGLMRHMENYQEALEVVNTTKQEVGATTNQMSDEEFLEFASNTEAGKEMIADGRDITRENYANYVGSKSGWHSYKVNASNIVFDLIQTAGIFKALKGRTRTGNAGLSSVAMAEASAVGKPLTGLAKYSTNYKGGLMMLGEAATEGLEEVVNFIGGEEGKVEGKRLIGQDPLEDTEGRIGAYLKEGHLWEQFFWGAIGGGVFAGIGRAAQSRTTKELEGQKLAEIENRKSLIEELNTKYKSVEDQLKAGTITKANADMQMSQLARTMGHRMGISAATAGNVDSLLNMINNPDYLEQFKVDAKTPEQAAIAKAEVLAELTDNILTAEKIYKGYYNKVWAEPVSERTKGQLVAIQTDIALDLVSKEKELTKLKTDNSTRLNEHKSLTQSTTPTDTFIRDAKVIALANIDAAVKAGEIPESQVARLSEESKRLQEEIAELDGRIGNSNRKSSSLNELDKALAEDLILEQITSSLVNTQKDQLRQVTKPDAAKKLDNKNKEEALAVAKAKEQLYKESITAAVDESAIDEAFLTTAIKTPGTSKEMQAFLKGELTRLQEINKNKAAATPSTPAPATAASSVNLNNIPDPVEATTKPEATKPSTTKPTEATALAVIDPAKRASFTKRVATIVKDTTTGRNAAIDSFIKGLLDMAPTEAAEQALQPAIDYLNSLKIVKETVPEVVPETVATAPKEDKSMPKPASELTDAELAGIVEAPAITNTEKEFIEAADKILPKNMINARNNGWNPVTGKKEGTQYELTRLYLAQLASDKFNSMLEELDASFKEKQLKANEAISDQKILQENEVLPKATENTEVEKTAKQKNASPQSAKKDGNKDELAGVPEKTVKPKAPSKAKTKKVSEELGGLLNELRDEIKKPDLGIADNNRLTDLVARIIAKLIELGYVAIEDMLTYIYRNIPDVFDAVFPVVKTEYVKAVNAGNINRIITDEQIEAITKESIINDTVEIIDANANAFLLDAMIISDMPDGGIVPIDTNKGIYQIKDKATEERINAMRDLKVGDIVELSIDRNSTFHQENLNNAAIVITINGVRLGYLNTIGSIEKALVKFGANTKFGTTLRANLIATKKLRNLVYNSNKPINVKVARKTSGTKIQGTLKNIKDVLLDGFEIYFGNDRENSGKNTVPDLEHVITGKVFTRNADGLSYYNHDAEYDTGAFYALVAGWNSDGTIATQIPLRLRMSNLSKEDAKNTYSIIREILMLVYKTPNIELNNQELLDLKDKLSNYILVNKNNVNTDGSVPVPGFKVHKDRIEFLAMDNNADGRPTYALATIYFNYDTGIPMLTLNKWHGGTKRYENQEAFNKAYDQKPYLTTTIGGTVGRDRIVSLLETKLYNGSIAKLRSGEQSLQDWIDAGRFQTDTGVLLDTEGNPVSNFMAQNPKNTKTQEGNLVISLETTPTTVSKRKSKAKPKAKKETVVEEEVAQPAVLESVATNITVEQSALKDRIEAIQPLISQDKTNYYIEGDAYERVSNVIKDYYDQPGSSSTDNTSAGTRIDEVIREFFISGKKETSVPGISDKVLTYLYNELEEINNRIVAAGKIVLASNVKVFHRDGLIAGEIDLLILNPDGTVEIYDIKTSTRSTVSPGYKKSSGAYISYAKHHAIQQSLYKVIFENQYGTEVKRIAILPFQIELDQAGNVIDIVREAGIPLVFDEDANTIIQNKIAKRNGTEVIEEDGFDLSEEELELGEVEDNTPTIADYESSLQTLVNGAIEQINNGEYDIVIKSRGLSKEAILDELNNVATTKDFAQILKKLC